MPTTHASLSLRACCALVITAVSCLLAGPASAEPVAVRHIEGITHGFLVLRTLDGARVADGDLLQFARGTRVTSRLVFHFKDGSLYDETTVFSQRGRFRLISDHQVQRGPSFPNPIDMRIDAGTGVVTVRYSDKGKEQQESERMDLPADLSNGLILTLLKNVEPKTPPKSFGFVVATPKPRLVKLSIASAREQAFWTDDQRRVATDYDLKVDIGGVAGLVAPLIGKQPPDSHVWILSSEVPTFVRSEQQLYLGGPVWRIELDVPAWRRDPAPR